MGLFTKRDKDGRRTDHPSGGNAPQGRSLVASAMPLVGPDGKAAWQASSGDAGWQAQAWYYYDAIGELRFAFNWLANAISRASLYAAEIDPNTGKISTDPTNDARAQAAAQAVLGGADDRPQLQSTMALQWQVSGETFVLILSQQTDPVTGNSIPDRWLCLSRRSMRERAGTWSYKDPLTGVWSKLNERDRVMRVWSPHPDEQTHADSAMRACLPILQEVEKSSQNIIARLDSRLASNGLYLIPQEIDFSSAESEQSSAQTFRQMLLDAMTVSMANPGTAEAQAPIVADVPGEWLQAMADGHVDFATIMDASVTELRKDALNRVGSTLDMPREMAMGELAQANHWSGWLIEESTYKIHVEPFLLKFGMALTKTWYRPALAAMGEANPDRFVLAWDITEVVARPDDKEDVKYLFENNLVSADWARSKFGVPDDAIPSEEEERHNLARIMVTSAPTTLENVSVARELGFDPTVPLTPSGAPAVDAPGEQPSGPRALPQTRDTEPDAALVAAAELVALDALGRAGGRLLTPTYRGQFKDVDRWALHTVIPVAPDRIDALLEGSFQHVSLIAGAFEQHHQLRGRLETYVRNRLFTRTAHDRDALREHLR